MCAVDSDCLHGGVCRKELVCTCMVGFSGRYCEEDLDADRGFHHVFLAVMIAVCIVCAVIVVEYRALRCAGRDKGKKMKKSNTTSSQQSGGLLV
mmetsp:Transcript_37586/g.61113  ORF Transcript_37586/g.61113 Transcript_37586/m.61113 type:complete len:94 (+) Transcript_37586:252-533(+)